MSSYATAGDTTASTISTVVPPTTLVVKNGSPARLAISRRDGGSDGASGLAVIGSCSPEPAVIDFMMAGMNGADEARHAQALRPGLAIVFVSGYSDTLALDGITGATVLRKPFESDALVQAVDLALETLTIGSARR